MTSVEIYFMKGDLVYYIGPPIVAPLKWDLIISNNNGILSEDDLGIVIDTDQFLKIADVFFQTNEILIKRLSFKKLKLAN